MSTRNRKFRIEFYQLFLTPNDDLKHASDGFDMLFASSDERHAEINSYVREISSLSEETGPKGFSGVMRKFRMSDLPNVGAPGGLETQLELAEGQGLVEKNYFRFFNRHNILGWQANSHANSATMLARLLSRLWSAKVQALPLIVGDAVGRLLKGKGSIKRLSVTVPRPTADDFTPSQDFNAKIFELLKASGGTTLHLSISASADDPKQKWLVNRVVRNAMAELATSADPSLARLDIDEEEEGFMPVDLLADRIVSYQDVEIHDNLLSKADLVRAINAGRRERLGDIKAYFGDDDEVGD